MRFPVTTQDAVQVPWELLVGSLRTSLYCLMVRPVMALFGIFSSAPWERTEGEF